MDGTTKATEFAQLLTCIEMNWMFSNNLDFRPMMMIACQQSRRFWRKKRKGKQFSGSAKTGSTDECSWLFQQTLAAVSYEHGK